MAYTTIDKPTDYFNTSTWTATTSAISNLDFSPDWVWIKSTDSANGHILFDTIRGANERLTSAGTDAESTRTDELMSFDSNGYTLGSSGNTNDTSPFNASYVGWSWRASDSSASSNTDGSITSSVSANTTAGFSIVSYTGNGSAGATVGHGLGSAPAVMLFKIRNTADNWRVYHQGIDTTAPEDYHVQLNSTGARIDNAGFFNDTAPTSSVFTLGSDSGINGSSNTFIAYCFAEKKGYSKFGSYTGNGSSDGSYIHLGFKPAFVLLKQTNSTNYWNIYDNKRDIDNAVGKRLHPNRSDAETSNTDMDFTAQGFKLRNSGANQNGSGSTYIFMAFAESPFVSSGGIPTVAR